MATQLVRVSFSRPSPRTDLHCWLMNVSVFNQTAKEITIQKIFFDNTELKTEYAGESSGAFSETQRKKIQEQIHSILNLPMTVPGNQSAMRIAVVPMNDPEEFSKPELHKVYIETNEGTMSVPLFRL
jgi:hypothetical protein